MPETSLKSAEHRRHSRVPSRLRCWCEGENVTVYARIGNLSEGGLFLRTSTPMPTGARTVVRFRDGDGREGADAEVSAEATVVWSRATAGEQPAGMGLKFDPMDPAKLEAIRRLVDRELKPSSGRTEEK